MNPDNINVHLKKFEVFADEQSVYTWESVADEDPPYVVVFSKTDLLLWGHELLKAIVDSQLTIKVEKVTNADRVVAEWTDRSVEVMTDDDTKVFTSRERWQAYWRSLDEWPKEIDAEGAK